jgi:hypothetical protein
MVLQSNLVVLPQLLNKILTRAITIDPQDAFAYYNRGVAKFELGDRQ